MKGFGLKKVMISISAFLFATCLGFGVAFAKAPVDAATLTSKNDFSTLDIDNPIETKGITIGDVANNYLVINKPIGNGSNYQRLMEMEVSLTIAEGGTLQGATLFGVGESNAASTYAASNKSGNGFANTEYIVYYHDEKGYAFVPFDENGTNTRKFYSTIKEDFQGDVTFRYSVEAYGGFNLELYVPSSNTQMSSSVARDEWIALLGTSDEFEEPSENIGWWTEYSALQSGTATGYPFMHLKNATVNTIKMKANNESVLEDDFSDSSAFASNYVTNDAFDAGVTAGKIQIPQASSVSVSSQAKEDVETTRGGALDMIRTNQSFKGAMRAELDLNSVGPTALLGFYSLNRGANAYVEVGLKGAKVQGFTETVWNEMGEANNWTKILGEDMSKFSAYSYNGIACMGGDYTLILDINEQGDATFSLWVRNLTLGDGLKTDEPYVLTTVEGLYADVVTGGGYLAFGATDSDWGHHTILQGIRLMDGNGEMLIEDDFSCNNFNGEGANLWLWQLSDETDETDSLYTLPDVNAVTFNGGTAYVNAQNTATEKEKLTITWNARVTSGEMKYYLGMDSKDTSTATAYLTVENGNLTLTQDTTLTLASGIDFTQKTQVKLEFNNAEKRVYAYVNGAQTATATLKADITGYMGIFATNAKLTYLTAEIDDAFTVIDTQNGAYLKANTTLEDSGIRFSSIIDKSWYDATVADETVASVTYGTLIVPTDYLLQVQQFTLAGLEASGLKYINAVVDNGFVNQATAAEDGYYQFMGGIKNILPANYTRNFSAVGYVTVTYENAETKTYYGEYNETDHSRSIYQLAGRTYGDRQAEAVGEYTYLLNDGTYAKYDQKVMDVMQTYLDSVVNVTLDSNGLNYVEVNDYYTKAYTATLSGNTVSVVSSKPISTIIINGIRQKDFNCVQDGDTYTASVTYAGIFDQQALFAMQTQVTEVTLANLKASYPNITAYTYKSVAYNSLAETQPFMAVGVPTTAMPEGGYPAIVLVHGGAGQVWLDWIKLWTEKGYIALALDMFANKLDDSLAKVVNPLGGPNESHSGSQIDDPNDYKNSWVYHSVTNVILCHNYLRSLPNVNADKIGITGISWGGFITNIVSGVDNRFAAFAPVYGAGYIYDDTTWNVTATDLDSWIKRYDPSSYVIFNTKPTLYVSGINDNCFALRNRVKTYALAKDDVYYSQRSDLQHGYYWNETQEIYYFMEKILNGVADSETGFVNTTVRLDDGKVAYVKINNYAEVKDKIASANLVYTTDTDADTHAWTFTTSPITFNENGEAAVDFETFNIAVTAFNFEMVMTEANYRLSTAIIMA